MYMSTDNIEVGVNKVELEGVDWIVMAKDRDKVLAFTSLKMELFSKKFSCAIISITRNFLLNVTG